MRRARAILFDWDGTLLDSFPSCYRASIAVLEHYGFSVDRERFLETYSPNWYDAYEKLGLPRNEWDNADQMWRRTYRTEASELFPFTKTLLADLRDRDLTLGLVTSGDRDRVHTELSSHGLDGVFATVVCFEDTEEKKPNAAPLERALEELATTPGESVYVGDRPEDIEMGKTVGAFTVGVESEYGPRTILEAARPDLVLPDASHLLARLPG